MDPLRWKKTNIKKLHPETGLHLGLNSTGCRWFVIIDHHVINYQWPFQDPKMEVPTIYKTYIRPKFQGIFPQNMT